MRGYRLHPDAQAVVDAYYLDSAEEDYLVARWAAQNARLHQFCWSAAQTAEKTIKAIALKNRVSLNGGTGGHYFSNLFTKLADDGFIPKRAFEVNPEIPEAMIASTRFPGCMHLRNIGDVLQRFETIGVPGIRYRNTVESSIAFAEVHLLDALFFLLRELAGRPNPASEASPSTGENSVSATELFVRRFPKISGPPGGPRDRNARIITFQNVKFFPEFFTPGGSLIGGYARRINPWALRRSNAEFFGDIRAKEDLEWLITNIRANGDDQKGLKSMLERFVTDALDQPKPL